MRLTAFVFLMLFTLSPLQALDLHSLFTPNAVLQQGMPVPIWGTAKVGASVTVEFAGQSVSAKANEKGAWMAVLAPLAASEKPSVLTVSTSDDSLDVPGVLVGEVWIGSGQSNMAMSVERSFEAEEAVTAAAAGQFPHVRLFRVPVDGADEPRSDVEANWSLCSAEAVARFSATAFYFAAKLSKDRGVPVGIIQSANGGTNAYSWINSGTYESEPVAEDVRDYWAATVKNHPSAMERYKGLLETYREEAKAARAKGEKLAERAPREPLGPTHVKRPTGHYNAMIAPLQPFAVRGVIWYQGEANSRLPFYPGYKELMLALAEDWRADWASASGGMVKRRDFPFYLVQLPNFAGGDGEGWPRIREQMLRFWQEGENTGMVVTIDRGEANDIHPRDKRPVGERLARFARAETYGEDIVFSGPIFDSLRIDGDTAFLTFDHSGSGLTSLDDEPLRHFEIAGEDKKFVPATARIEDGELVVSSKAVAEPRAVRYAWKSNPEKANFGNREGLPASPFRTDSW